MTGRPDYLDEWDLDELFPPTSNGNGHAAEAPTGPSVPEIPGAPHREVKAHLRPEGGEPKPAPQAAEPPVEPRPEPQRQAGSISLPGHDLEPRDYKRLAASGISPELAAQAQLRRVDSNEGKAIVGGNGSGDYAGIVFPYIWPGQTRPREYRLRRDHPPIEYKNGKPREKDKYLSPPGRGNMVYFAPGADPEWLLNSDIPVVLTEGEKKTLALSVCARHGLSDATEPPRLLSIGVSGVWNWRGIIGKENGPDGDRRDEKGVIPDFDRLAWKGRKVTILFDTNVRDNEDVQWACRALTKELRRRGADVLWFNWPDDTPAEVNGIDDLIGLWGAEKVLGLITSQAHLIKPAGRSQARSEGADKRVNLEASSFRLTDDAVIYTDRDDPDKGPLRICDRLEVVSYTRDTHGNEWGRQLNWNDLEGRLHDWAMPMSLLAGDGTEVRARLMSEGLRIAPGRKARELLMIYLQTAQPKKQALCVSRVGWHKESFVLPGTTIGPENAETVLYQTPFETEHYFNIRGSVEDWRNNVGRYCRGNSRLVLSVSCSFAAPTLSLVGGESGGIHLTGLTSTGKTTVLVVGGSVVGGGGQNGFVRTWRTTTNGLEAVAELHNDLPLFLDELAQVDPRDAEETAYLLGNGTGKSRMNRNIGARKNLHWNLLFVSAGETTLADHAAAAGKRPRGGALVRLVNVDADAGAGLGLFENLHGAESADAFARQLKEGAKQFYGAPIRAYLEYLVHNRAAVERAIRRFQADFLSRHVPADAAGEVSRVAQRFALIAAAGELATDAGITGWKSGEAIAAGARWLESWIAGRGTTGAADKEAALRQVRRFLEAHGASRFHVVRSGATDPQNENQIVVNRAGYRQQTPDGQTEFLVLPETFKSEVCAGFDYRMVARTLNERGFLEWQPPHLTKRVRLPGGLGLAKVFCIKASILEG